MNIYTQNLPVCNSGEHTYVMALFNFFFLLQDLIDRIDSYFQRIAFQRTCFLLASSTLRHKFFPIKISSLHGNGTMQTGKDKLWQKVAGEYQISKSPFF